MNDSQEESYNSMIEHYKKFYPNKKVRIIGYGIKDLDAIENYEDLKGIIKNYDVKCSFCGKPIKDIDWIVILHNPPESDKPINVLFFCFDTQCYTKWAKKRAKKVDWSKGVYVR